MTHWIEWSEAGSTIKAWASYATAREAAAAWVRMVESQPLSLQVDLYINGVRAE
jgi:hypothetical protein